MLGEKGLVAGIMLAASPFRLSIPFNPKGGLFMFQVTLYTDGSCLGNPGPGGYAAILQCNGYFDRLSTGYFDRLSTGRTKEITGSANHTTNNRMELQAVIAGLQALKRRCQVTLVTDSQYVATVLNGGRAKANLDLVQQLRQLACQHDITVQQVRSHAGYTLAGSAQAMNEQCDQLAKAAARQRKQMMAQSREVDKCAA
jgi:ribonuclease HI